MSDIFKQLNDEFGLNITPPETPRTIWKYDLVEKTVTHQIPVGAQFLSAAPTTLGLSMWFLVDPAAATEARHFTIAITGKPLPTGYVRFIATVAQTGMTPKGPRTLVTHVVEVES